MDWWLNVYPILSSWVPADTKSNVAVPETKTAEAKGATAASPSSDDPKSLYKEARSQLKPAQKPDFAGAASAGAAAEKPENNPVEKLIRQSSLSKQPSAETSGLSKPKKVLRISCSGFHFNISTVWICASWSDSSLLYSAKRHPRQRRKSFWFWITPKTSERTWSKWAAKVLRSQSGRRKTRPRYLNRHQVTYPHKYPRYHNHLVAVTPSLHNMYPNS